MLAITSIAESNVSLVRKLDTINVIPGHVEGPLWHNTSATLIQDVSEDALYQGFSKTNSAYFDGSKPTSEPDTQQSQAQPQTVDMTTDSASDSQNEDTESVPSETPTETAPEPTESVPSETPTETAPEPTETVPSEVPEESVPETFEAAPETPSEPEVVSMGDTSKMLFEANFGYVQKEFFLFTNSTHKLLPLAMESIVSPLSDAESVSLDEVVQDPVTPTEVIPTSVEESSNSDTEVLDQVLNTENETLDDVPTDEVLQQTETPSADLESALTFTDFSLPQLNSGQFIKGAQLRMSLAGFIKNIPEGELFPSVEVEYTFGEKWMSAGTVLLDGEVSNALNGGYFLFALPKIQKQSELTDFSVRLRYAGDVENIDALYVDSVWLELNTETFDKNIFKERILPQSLGHLKQSTMYEFISTTLDFTRDELPKFSFRYESQRNIAVQFIRNLFGRNLAEINDIKFKNINSGQVDIKPDINITNDGLFTIQFTEADKKKLQPGEYTIEITMDEGGKNFTDSFNFQWGMLALNPDQTEYELGDTSTIALGALTRNGNTLCDAHLQLYIIDPLEYISEVPVFASGLCSGNNIIDVPDYSASFTPTVPGTYEMYVERIAEDGEVLSHTSDTFMVAEIHDVSVSRNGPTRIYPPSPYPMQITINADADFIGTLTERVPRTFTITNTDANISEVGDSYELTWDVQIGVGGQQTFSYDFDAPDLSPYLYTLGPATLVSDSFNASAKKPIQIDNNSTTTIASTSPALVEVPKQQKKNFTFTEHRAWQIASDATGNMVLFWDNANGIPSGWTCVSCTSTSTFYQRFIQGSSTYNNAGGATTHTPTAAGSFLATGSSATENFGTAAIDVVSHTHTYTPTIASASNLPNYRQLEVIQYTASAGEPASIPTGAIGVFDATVPTGWTQYSAQDGYYIRGENAIGSTGGSNTHTHAISGTSGNGAGTTVGNRGGGTPANGAPAGHTHTVSTTTPTTNNEPPYVTVILGKINATSTAPNGLIAMWTDTVPTSWLDVSTSGGDAFNNKFLKADSTYGATGGSNTHVHTDMSSITSSGSSGVAVVGRTGSPGAAFTHTHSVSVSSFSTDTNTPPYVTVIFGKRQGTNPVFTQLSSRWYVNTNAQLPTDPWPSGATDLLEAESISATSTPVKNGDVIRLRINALIGNATATASTTMKLQYASTTDTCNAITSWNYVGSATSSAEWQGYNNASVSDHGTLATSTLASTTVKETYEENGYTVAIPNDVIVGGVGEWDFVLKQNGASAGANYCFRMVESDGAAFYSYSHYAQLRTDYAPVAPTLLKLFDNEKTASTTPWFEFVTTDPEADDLNYEIQIDNNSDFSSAVVDHDTVNNGELFENLVVPSDKDPFTSGELMRYIPSTSFSNGITYWWRVRAKDPDGSNQWGSWATAQSFTIDTSLAASTWFQTTEAQFDTNGLVRLDAVISNQLELASGSTTGTMTTDSIDFDNGSLGTAWASLSWNDSEPPGDIKYHLEYLNTLDQWGLIPDTDLSGNNTGFDTSPVNLLDLDTSTYNEIRIVADFVSTSTTPSLQDITISWGYRVATPSITKLFPNEKVGTTTPTFEFSTTDPQSDSLTYQISWSTVDTFTSSTTRTSDVNAGFVNADQGGDLDPFTSGETIQFTVQGSDALTDNTTYWWRVRAKDTAGSNAYSLWTTAQSFTASSSVTVSTWYQTTKEQFETNILSGTQALSSNVLAVATTASEAMLVYGEGIQTTPRYKTWDGSVWSSEGSLADVGAPIKWAVVKAGTTREEYVAATIGTDADINAQVYALGVWGDLQEVTTSVADISARGFDVAYETLSGDAMVAYCDGDADPSYYLWDGTSWTSGGTINLASANNCAWIRLASDPTSNEIMLLSRDTTGSTYEAQVWNATTSSWGNSTSQGSVIDSGDEGMSVEYEESGGQAIIITSDGNPARFRYNTWNGTAWSGAATQAIGNDFEWGDLVRDNGSDELALCYLDEDLDIGVVHWTGSAWTGQTELDQNGNAKTDQAVSCVYETIGSRDNYVMTAYGSTTGSGYSSWNNTSWSTGAIINAIGDSATMKLIRTGVGTILGVFFHDPSDELLTTSWNGTSWATTTVIESNASVDTSPFGRPYDLTPRNSGRTGTTVVSPGIDFDDGVGPYWSQMSWIDTTPGTSDILYSVQYYNTVSSAWEFIPDGVIPGNSVGTTTSPINLSGLNIATYSLIRPYASLTCDSSNNCPTLSDWTVTWAAGITVSGSLMQYDQVASTTSGTIAVAVNGVLQIGKTGAVSNGTWSVENVTTFAGDIVTVFVNGAPDANEAVGVTRYDGSGDITGLSLYERHVALGSNDATTTAITNSNIGLYDYTNSEDLFDNATGTALSICVEAGCTDAELIIKSGTTYQPTGTLTTHDLEINGTLLAQGNTLTISGSWDNNATATLATSTVVFSATSTAEAIDGTGSINNTFYNVTFGIATNTANWTAATTLDIDNDLNVSYGTLSRSGIAITVAGSLTTGAGGYWSGMGTTTFDGSVSKTVADNNATLQNIGNVVINGTSKTITLAGNVLVQSMLIGADDILDVSTSNYSITTLLDWINNNTFVARSGTVYFAATTTNRIITANSSAFYSMSFTGAGAWSFTEANITVNNNLTIGAGIVTMPTGTTTLAGSFSSVGGTFAHNNATVLFTAASAKTIAASGTPFTNAFYNMKFTGSGSWTFLDTSATTSHNILITQGTVTLPANTLTVGGDFSNTAGTFVHNSGTVTFISATAQTITTNSSFNNLSFTGIGSWSFTNTSVTALGNLSVMSGTLTLPSNTLSLGGSLTNSAGITHNSGTVLFNATGLGRTVSLGNSSLYNMTFNGVGGGWTVSSSATTTNNFTLATTSSFALASGQTLSIGGTFTNSVGGASTTWTGSVLSLESGNYSINTKTNSGDVYDTLRVKASTNIQMWNSSATTYDVHSTGSLYSQDHAAVDGYLYIFGNYTRTFGNEYWSYATDFDGTALTASTSRQVNVRLANGASAQFTTSSLNIVGTGIASTTIANQGSGSYTLSVTNGTTTAAYYEFSDLGSTGLTLAGSTHVSSLADGRFVPSVGSGSGLTVSSTTIDANPGLQIYRVNFSTTTNIAAFNVSQTDGTPASYWWFRDSSGNIDGEIFDNDTGDPGSIRWDDSSLVVTVSGTVYQDDGTTPLGAATCDDVTQNIRIVVQGGTSYTGSCASSDGTFSIGGVVIVGSPVITAYLDTNGGTQGTAITKTPTADITNFNIYANRIITRHQDVDPLTIADMAVFDFGNDSDIRFDAATGTTNTLTVFAGNELHIASSTTFAPGGNITINGNASSTSQDGSLHIDDNAVFTGSATSTYTIGGSFTMDQGATFSAASSTVIMNATTTGKTVTTPTSQTITFNTLTFNGLGGGWNINGNVKALQDINVTQGTVTGTKDVTVVNGSLSGNGTFSMGSGTTTVEQTNILGGTTPWTFGNLVLGNGTVTGTTTPGGATTTILGKLTIATAHFLNGGGTVWNLAGTGNVFVENGTFLEGTTTVRYSGAGATNIISTTYYNLDLMAVGSAPTYTATGLGIIVSNNLTLGGATTTTFTLNTNDPAFDVNGSVSIMSTGVLEGSNSAAYTIAGSWDNDGTFNGNGGTVTFDSSGTKTIAAGSSSFSNVNINGAGTFTLSEHATSSGAFTLTNATAFTVNSGQVLAVGGAFTNSIGGAATTWTGSTLSLYSGTNYSINASTTNDVYDTLQVGANTDIRMWNSSANTYTVSSSGSLYSQDHAGVNGHLYVFGNYPGSGGTDYWSYATDFDGTSLAGSERKVDVYFDSGSSVDIVTGGLSVIGATNASTTLQNQGSGSYRFHIGGTTATTWSYYEVRNTDAAGLTFSGTPSVSTLSYGDFIVSQNSGTAITVGGTVINQNPAKTFTNNNFATSSSIAPAVNVTATGTSVSSWRFTNHSGSIDGETYDVDPTGDPGYVVWDDSAAFITISGTVYADEGSATSTACDGVTNNIHLRVAGLTSYTTTCNASTGVYSIPGIVYSPGDSLIVYIDGVSQKAATVSEDPVSSIGNMDLYENRVIVRHENSDPLSIADMAIWDSSDDADIPFTAVDAGTDTLTLPANRKLIIWSGKTFEPLGDVTLSGGGGAAYDGTLELFASAVFDATGSETHTIGGSFISGSGATFDGETSTLIFTTTGTARTVDSNASSFYNLIFNGSGSWTVTDATLGVGNDFTITQGAVTLPTGTTTVTGSLSVTSGSFNANGGTMLFNGSASKTIRASTSSFNTLTIDGSGSFTMLGTNATTTADVRVQNGTFTSATGTLTVGGSLINRGTFIHGSGLLRFTSSGSSLVTTSGSDLFSTTFAGSGAYTFTDTNEALLGTLRIENGSVNFASGTMSIGGSLLNTGGTFNHATGTLLFNSSDVGETINPGSSLFHVVSFASAGGGWTITNNATATSNFSLVSATNFTLSSSTQLAVGGVFTNLVGGAATTWSGSTLVINSGTGYTINTKIAGGDTYNNVHIGSSTALRAWDSTGAITMTDSASSFYSQDNAGVSGALNIYGNYTRSTGTDYWSYATDFDGVALGGSSRQVFVYMGNGASTTITGGALNIIGANGFDTTISNQGSGTYTMDILGGTFNAQYYSFSNLDVDGLTLSGTTAVTSLTEGNFILAVNGGSLITLSSTTLNYNAGLVISNTSFATTTAITGTNIKLVGTTPSAWILTGHTGNFDGENFDYDGGDACSSIRWDDSSCLLTQQSVYRFRYDDGGEGVPNSEWYDQNWTKRKRVKISNADATVYTNAAIKLNVTYDADMQADFDDLRFTNSSGTTLVNHFIETYTGSTNAVVWVEVPTLAASADTEVYMYYGNGGASVGNATSTFNAIDTFEDGNISEYSGDTGEFTISGTSAYERTYRLNASDPTNGKTDFGGMYNNSVTVSQGETLRVLKYIDTASGSGDEVCTTFGTQTQTANYGVCLELFGTDRMSLVKDVLHRDTSGTVLASTTVAYTTGWYEVEIDWRTDDSMYVTLSQNGTVVATTSATNSSYTSGGIGYTLWGYHGGWDIYSARPLLETEPTTSFGSEQVPGGATWLAAENTKGSGVLIDDTLRVRFLIENTGLPVVNQNYILESAPKGVSPSCEAVNYANFTPVPVAASCGTSEICMTSSTYINNQDATTDLIGGNGTNTPGQIIEDPSNITGNITIQNNEFSEMEYVITPTLNAVDPSYCLRVTNNGTDLDSYSRVAELELLFAPNITSLSLNGGVDITLVGGSTTTIMATGTVSDQNGYTNLVGATSTIFRSGVGESCSLDNNNCYISGNSNCSFVNCAGNSCDVTCSADIYYHADPTDIGTFAAETWRALLAVSDAQGSIATATAPSIDLLTLHALSVDNNINYGALAADADTGSYNATTTVENLGNDSIDIALDGTDLTDGGSSAIPVYEQKFATSSFTYSSCVFCSALSTTTTNYQLNLAKPASTTPAITSEIFWGIAVPFGVSGTPHQGTNTFYAIGN